MDQVIIGVDTHKSNHIAVAINTHGARLGEKTIPTTSRGYRDLEIWASGFGQVKAFGIEGTGSFGANLSRALMAKGHVVMDVMRPNRQIRYLQGKSDALDAEGAARSVLNGQTTALAKTQTGTSEMLRHLKVARDSAVKARSQAMITLKTLIINAPVELRDTLEKINGRITLIRHLAAWHQPTQINSPTASAKMVLRSIARRCLALHEEVDGHDRELERMAHEKAPGLMASHGISTMTVAEMLILVGDNPERIRSEAALAKLCGVCPVPASSGKTNRMRLNRGGNRQANAALYRVAIVRMRDHEMTRAYVAKRTTEGKTRREIVRCLERYIVREIYRHLCGSQTSPRPV
ncbi:IS110 family RNA-guided transposase [Kozakia baliensis]|uniref:Transposase n=1 Tax=Kozakia baliensis TaxID=153496 RepID=A0A1D8UXV9_9PROT|nr:IS110 family transposase [Kozakia baliensis]AOX18441.1 transposase [Kozakia baliensis]AOX21724.1 transposase [Kozakia baliensis]GBR32912.1 transposase [Kozakia baliensis NRIC 0488]